MNKKINKTTQVVRDAMKAVSKDVRAPKVVREGKVQPKLYHPKKTTSYVKSLTLDELKFSKKEIKNVPSFSQRCEYESIWGGRDYKQMLSFDDIELCIDTTDKKLQKIIKLVHAQLNSPTVIYHQLRIEIYNPDFKSTTHAFAEGSISSVSSNEKGPIALTIRPNHIALSVD